MGRDEVLSIGFIGGGINSAVGDTHRIASQMDGRWKLVAGCFSKHSEINKETSEEYGVSYDRVYDNWEEMLEKEQGRLDAVCILTPTNVHGEMILAAIEKGYAVICEKAMVSNKDDALKILELVHKKESFFAVTYNYTGYPMIRELKDMIQNGKLGKIKQITAEMPQEGFIRFNKGNTLPHPQGWRMVDGEIPTISLDLGVHLHNLVYFLTGKQPLRVIATEDSFGHFNQVVDNVIGMIEYTDQMKGQIWYSKSALGHRNGLKIRVYGDKASAKWFQMQPETITMSDNHGNIQIIDRAADVCIADALRYNRFKAGHPSGFIEAFGNYYYDLADALIAHKKGEYYSSSYVFGVEHATEGLKMLTAMHESYLKSEWVSIDSIK